MNAEQSAREAMDLWREACQASQDAFYEADGMFANDPEAVQQSRHADQAAASVIAAKLAEKDAAVGVDEGDDECCVCLFVDYRKFIPELIIIHKASYGRCRRKRDDVVIRHPLPLRRSRAQLVKCLHHLAPSGLRGRIGRGL